MKGKWWALVVSVTFVVSITALYVLQKPSRKEGKFRVGFLPVT